jgi:hypothetical protein
MIEYTRVKYNTHGMSTLLRMDTVDGMTAYGLVSSFQSPRLAFEISSEMFEKEAIMSMNPLEDLNPNLFFLAFSNLGDEIFFRVVVCNIPIFFQILEC